MKIALVVHDLHEQGGHSLYTRVLADRLAQRHDVTVFANRCERPDGSSWGSAHVRASRFNAWTSVHTFPLGLLEHRTRLGEFDVVHSQGYCGGKPNVVTAHICVAAYLASLQGLKVLNRLSLRSMAAAEASFYRGFDGTVIAVSQKVADDLREHYQVKAPIKVVPHGIDAERFLKVDRSAARANLILSLKMRPEKTLVLYVGDLTKAHSHLRALASKCSQIEMLVVTYSRAYRWEAANVHFLEPTNQIEHYYRGVDGFVFPTTYDSFGMVLLEAMAAGLPVFTSDKAGAAELIEPNVDGFVLPLDEWVESTAKWLRRSDSLAVVGHRAMAKARQHAWEAVVSSVENIYENVLAPQVTFRCETLMNANM